MSENDVGVFLKIYGRVQGVGYRAFAQQVAERLNLRGYVRNLDDGTVEVHAEGSRDALERFIKELERGPFLAVVERIDARWDKARGEYSEFLILL